MEVLSALFVNKRWSWPISRVLSWTVIHLELCHHNPQATYPGTMWATRCSPIWSCSEWGLPCRRMLPPTRCALTAPFQPYRFS